MPLFTKAAARSSSRKYWLDFRNAISLKWLGKHVTTMGDLHDALVTAYEERAAAAKRPKPTAPSAKHSGSNQTH